MNNSVALEVKNLGKRYYRRKDVHRSVKSFILDRFRRHRIKANEFWALRNASFEVHHGETLGIIGANGAGKSTLLSLIAQTTAPTEGSVHIKGRVGSLLELGAGFHPDLTGRENVFLNASILGLTKKETTEKYDEILDLADIGDAINSPVKYYSSGMYVRLAFAVAVMCDPDILLMDEVLAVGDESFRSKSMNRIESFRTSGKTLLIVSHDLEAIKKLSSRVLLLNEGKILEMGDAFEVVDHYRNFSIYQEGNITVKEFGNRDVSIESVTLTSENQSIEDELQSMKPLTISLELKSKLKVEHPVIGFSFTDNLGNVVYGTNTDLENVSIPSIEGSRNLTIHLPQVNLQRGNFYLSLAVHNKDHSEQYHRMDNFKKIRITTPKRTEGYLVLPSKIEIGEGS